MIKSIKITNHLNQSIVLELFNPDSSGFVIKKITGLGPAKANINLTELATNDGAIDNSARLQTRNIVLDLEFIGTPTIEDTRLKSYKYFPIKQNVEFLIETDSRVCKTIGRIESNEPNIFSKNEGCQISIVCPDPYFYSAGPYGKKKVTFYGVDPLFEFPFSNESLTEDLIEFGDIHTQTEGNVYYEGDAEIGVSINIHSLGEVEGLSIYNTGSREVMRIDDEKLIDIMGTGIQAGDTIIINTTRGSKGIKMIRNGEVTNILNVLDKPVQWFRLVKGDNLFAFTATSGLFNVQFNIEYELAYEGV